MAFWNSSIGDNAKDRVHEAILSHLPLPEKPMTLSASLSGLEKMQDSTLLVFAGAASIATYSLVVGFVKTIKSGVPPALDKAGHSQFMTKVRDRLSNFLTYKPRTSGASSAGSAGPPAGAVVYGKAAAAHRYNDIMAASKKKDGPSVVDVSILTCFSYLLSSEQAKELSKIGASILAKTGSNITAPSAKKLKKTAGSLAPDDAKAMVAMLFKR